MHIRFVPDGSSEGAIYFTSALGKLAYRWQDGRVFRCFPDLYRIDVGKAATRERAVRLARLDLRRLLYRGHKALVASDVFTQAL